jgi:hypothetical protein
MRAAPIDLTPSLLGEPAASAAEATSPIDYRRIGPEDLEPKLRLLPPLAPPEPRWRRAIFMLVALVLTGGFAYMLWGFWAPAPGRPGIDQNGYLVGAKQIAQHHTYLYKPREEYQFIGAMWNRTESATHEPGISWPAWLKRKLTVQTDEGNYYPKYPPGVSLLDAVGIWIGKPLGHGRDWAFMVSPICTALAVLGMYFLGRLVVSPFYAVLAMIVLAGGQTTLEHSLDPNSHAPDLCMCVWGMYFLIRWLSTGSWWRGVLGGLILGFAVSIRYTNAMLLFPLYPLDMLLKDVAALSSGSDFQAAHPSIWKALTIAIKVAKVLPIGPIGLAVLFSLRWRKLGSYPRAILPVLAWMLPVGLLVGYTWFNLGMMTTYDATKESEGFTIGKFAVKWDWTIHQIYLFGLFLFLSLGVGGTILLYRRSARVATLLMLWFLPGTLLYISYYWGWGIPGIWYLRFFLAMFPPLIVGGVWLLESALAGARPMLESRLRRGSFAGPLAAGILTAGTAAVGFMISIPNLERWHRGNLNLHYTAENFNRQIKTTSPRNKPVIPVAFADHGTIGQHIQYLQFMSDCDWYGTDAFDVRFGGGFGFMKMAQDGQQKDNNGAVTIQKERIDFQVNFTKGKSGADLVKEQHRVMNEAFADGRPVYALLTPTQKPEFLKRFINNAPYEAVLLDHWTEKCNITFPDETPQPPEGRPKDKVSPLGPRQMGHNLFINWEPEEFYMYEIKPKPPAPDPSTQPTKPASEPATVAHQ